jgi:SAM-dependent methyltransferase
MDDISIGYMDKFFKKYLDPDKEYKILDVGSCRVNPVHKIYRDLIKNPKWHYCGLDIQQGNNVDILAKSPEDWGIEKESYDVVISGQVLEHVNDMVSFMLSMKSALKKDGLMCVIAPWSGRFHRHPIDCWRILPDGMIWLLEKICNLTILEVSSKEDLVTPKDNILCFGIAKRDKD